MIIAIFSLLNFMTMTSGIDDDSEKSNLLLFASAGGEGRSQGFYAADVDGSDVDVSVENLRRISYNCLNLEEEYLNSMNVKSVSLDAITGKVLVHVGHLMNRKRLTLFRVPLCKHLHNVCDSSSGNDAIEPILIDVTSYSHSVEAVVSHDDVIYMITEKEEEVRGSNRKRKTIELRKLSGCEGSGISFYMDTCTQLVTTIKVDEFKNAARFSATSGLAAVPVKTPTSADDVVFYTQLHHLEKRSNQRNNDVRFEAGAPNQPRSAFLLRRVTLNGTVTNLYEEYLSDQHTRYVIEALGQVAYREGMLCWAALDRVNCGMIDINGFVSNTRTIASTEDVRRVCAQKGTVLWPLTS